MSANGAAMDPAEVERQVRSGFELLRAGRVDAAAACLRSLDRAPPDLRVSLLACEVAEAARGPAAALEVVNDALDRLGDQAALHLKRAQLLLGLRRVSAAIASARSAVEAGISEPHLLQAAARVHLQHGDPAEAKPLLLRAVAMRGEDPVLLYITALCHFYLNEMDAAAALLDRALRIAPGLGPALHVRSQLRTQTAEANNVADLRRVLSMPDLAAGDRMLASFALAKELEDLGDEAASFEALRVANRLKRATLEYDVRDDVRSMQEVAAAFTKESLDRIPDGDPTPGAIFVVGMPRSGTTLVERILASHSAVVSIGEAIEFPSEMTSLAQETLARGGVDGATLLEASLRMDFAELGRRYLAAVRPRARGRACTVDKLPFNFRYCGLIHKALPNARLIHLSRDPMDSCYAVYKRLFVNSYFFAYQLDEIAEFYVAYRRMMDHWRATLPGVILDVSYEQLVADPPAQCRRLLEFCGLPWEDSVLEFHRSKIASTTASAAQVRKPFYTSSVTKWRSVADQLQPVRQRLAAAGLVDADGNPIDPSRGG